MTVNSGTTNTVAQFTSTDSGAGIKLTDNTGSSSVQTTDEVLRIGVDDDAAVASSAIAFRVDGSEKARIDSSGNVGIGTSSPADELDISSVSPAIRLTDTTTAGLYHTIVSASDDLVISADAGNVGASTEIEFVIDGTERMRIDSSGNVGIGTSSPSGFGLFTVSGSGITNHINSTSGAGGINFYETGSGRFSLRTLNGSAGLAFYDTFNTTERMRINSSGNVGIANTSPAYTLDVTGTINASTDVKINGASAATTGKAIAMALVFG